MAWGSYPQSSSRSNADTFRALASTVKVLGCGFPRVPFSIIAIVLWLRPALSASSFCVNPDPRRNRLNFSAVVAIVSIIFVLTPYRQRIYHNLTISHFSRIWNYILVKHLTMVINRDSITTTDKKKDPRGEPGRTSRRSEAKGETMATQIIPKTREQKGIELALTRSEEFERVAPFAWIVPGSDCFYGVDLELGCCSCPDYGIRRERDRGTRLVTEPCKHIYAVEVVAAKRREARRLLRVVS